MRRLLLIGISAIALTGCQTMGVGSSTPTYQTFQGKFIDTPKVQEAAARQPQARGPGIGPAAPMSANDLRALSGVPDVLSRGVYLDTAGIVDSKPLSDYLHGVLEQVLAAWPGDKPEIKIWVRASETFVPHAAVGNDIFLSIGALTNLENEHQLAGVLAHEAAHILLNHFDREKAMDSQRKTVSAASSMVVLGAALADTRIDQQAGGGFQVGSKGDKDNADLAMKGLAAGLILMELTDTLIDPSWNREQENEADLLALDLMVAANYNPGAYQEVLQKLATLQKERKTRFSELQKNLGPAMLASLSSFNLEQMQSDATNLGVTAGLTLIQDWRDEQRLRYLSPEERIGAVAAYVDREHIKRDRRAIATRPDNYKKVIREGDVARVIANHQSSIRAMNLLTEGDVRQALQLAELGASGITKDAVHPRYVLSIVQRAAGRPQESLANLEFAAKSELAPAIVYTDLATRYLDAEKGEKALETLNKGTERFGGEERFLPTKIKVQLSMERAEDAKGSYERCMKNESVELKKQCATAYGVEYKETEGIGGFLNLLGS